MNEARATNDDAKNIVMTVAQSGRYRVAYKRPTIIMQQRLQLLIIGILLICACRVFAEGNAAPTAEDKALAARIRALIALAPGKPAQEYVVHALPNYREPHELLVLTGATPVSEKQLADARTAMTVLVQEFQRAIDWPTPPSFTVPHTVKPITIDGKLADPAWKHAISFTRQYPFNQTQPAIAPKTTWHMLWDARYLYVGMECADTDIIAPVLPRDGEVFNHDCFEVLLLPEPATRKYWELEVGATGSIFDALNVKNMTIWGANYHPEVNMTGLRVATHIDGVANKPGAVSRGYSIEMAIPFDQLPGMTPGQQATAGTHLHCLLTHFDRHADGRLDLYAFCPVLTWVHNIWNYADMTLGK